MTSWHMIFSSCHITLHILKSLSAALLVDDSAYDNPTMNEKNVPEQGSHEWVCESQPGEPLFSASDLRTPRAYRLYANL